MKEIFLNQLVGFVLKQEINKCGSFILKEKTQKINLSTYFLKVIFFFKSVYFQRTVFQISWSNCYKLIIICLNFLYFHFMLVFLVVWWFEESFEIDEQFLSFWSKGKARYQKSDARNGSRTKEGGFGKTSNRRKEKQNHKLVEELCIIFFAFQCIILCVEFLWWKYGQTCYNKWLQFCILC